MKTPTLIPTLHIVDCGIAHRERTERASGKLRERFLHGGRVIHRMLVVHGRNTLERVHKRGRFMRPASQRRLLQVHRDKILCVELRGELFFGSSQQVLREVRMSLLTTGFTSHRVGPPPIMSMSTHNCGFGCRLAVAPRRSRRCSVLLHQRSASVAGKRRRAPPPPPRAARAGVALSPPGKRRFSGGGERCSRPSTSASLPERELPRVEVVLSRIGRSCFLPTVEKDRRGAAKPCCRSALSQRCCCTMHSTLLLVAQTAVPQR